MKSVNLIVIILISFAVSISAWANEPKRGYRGFVDANVDLQFYQNYYGDKHTDVFYGISTSHGYQFNPHFFLGAGLMCEHSISHSDYLLGYFPIFIQARTDWKFGRFPLYGDLRAGGIIFGEYRIFISPTVGYRLNLGRKSNLNFGIGINLRGCSWTDEKTFHPELAVRVGIDF